MTADDLRSQLGPDLGALVTTVGVPLTALTEITGLPSEVLSRATFRLVFADGRVVKGRRFGGPGAAARMVDIARALALPRLPRVLARRGVAVLKEWIAGSALDASAATPDLLRSCGALLAAIHRVPSGDGAWRAGALPLRDRTTATVAGLARLEALGWLTAGEARRLLKLVEAGAPRTAELGFIHRDFCAENIVLGPGGELYVVDNETLAYDAYDFDLARTRYRWPMGAAAWAAFEQGYGASRDLGSYRAHATWWAVAVLVEAALFRHRARTPRAMAPVEHLLALLATGRIVTPASSAGPAGRPGSRGSRAPC